MTLLRSLSLAAASVLMMSFSCKKTEDLPCTTSAVDFLPVSNWTYSGNCFAVPVTSAQSQTYVINSDAELQALNHCGPAPAIDFARYTLLAGKTMTAACSLVGSQQVTQTCGAYTYQVTLLGAPCQAPTQVMYCVLVPKLPVGTSVAFDVKLP